MENKNIKIRKQSETMAMRSSKTNTNIKLLNNINMLTVLGGGRLNFYQDLLKFNRQHKNKKQIQKEKFKKLQESMEELHLENQNK